MKKAIFITTICVFCLAGCKQSVKEKYPDCISCTDYDSDENNRKTDSLEREIRETNKKLNEKTKNVTDYIKELQEDNKK